MAKRKTAARRRTKSSTARPVRRARAGRRPRAAPKKRGRAAKPRKPGPARKTVRAAPRRKPAARPTPRATKPVRTRKAVARRLASLKKASLRHKAAGRAAAARSATPPVPAEQKPRRADRPPAHSEPRLNRERRLLSEDERLDPATDLADDRMVRAARTGRRELQEKLAQHTEASPEITAGDVDARWEDAYAVGDEAPGGDNPTPDQDRVDDIGRALGVEYQDAEELKGSDKIAERDRRRWELDPASSEDWPHGKKNG